MQLNSIDKYIKEKLKGYKPAYQEDLWKGIEEKLPASRVPNSKGSWMIPAAAAVVIVALIPALIKFNKLTDKNTEVIYTAIQSVPKIESDPGTLPSRTKIRDQKNKKSFFNQNIEKSTAKIIPSKSSGLVFFNKRKNRQKNEGDYLQSESGNVSPDVAGITKINLEGRENNSESIDCHKSLMAFVLPKVAFVDDEMRSDVLISGKCAEQIGKYIDRGAHSKHTAWANWQSIYYPFWQNAAYAGSEGKLNLTIDDKIDFTSNGQALNYHNNFAFDMRVPFGGLGVGIFHSRDLSPYALQSTTGIAISKIIFRTQQSSLKIGLSGTVLNNSLFFNALNYPDQIDPVLGIKYASKDDPVAMSQAFGLNAGIWFSHPHIVLGTDIQNLNQPHLQHISEAAPLPRQMRTTIGYRFSTSRNLQWLPMAIFTRKSGINQANTTLTAVYKNKIMATIAYQNISPVTGRGNFLVYLGANIKKDYRVFASYGYNVELAHIGVNEPFLHMGIKIQRP